MRILYFIGSYGPHLLGNDVHEETCKYLVHKGHYVEVVTPEKGPYVPGHIPVNRLPQATGPVRKLLGRISSRIFKYNQFLDLWSSYGEFLDKRKKDFDVVHVEAAYPFGVIHTLADPWRKLPSVVNLQGADVMACPEVDYGYARYKIPLLLTSIALRRAKAVRANSYHTEKIARAMGASKRRTVTIPRNVRERAYLPDGANVAHYRQESRRMLEERYGLARDAKIVIALSRLHPFKGIEYLVRAMPEVVRNHPQSVLLVCGPSRKTPKFGDYVEYLKKIAVGIGVEKSIVFTGAVNYEEVRDHLAGANVLVVPSVVEALNKVVVEAAAVGTPSVVTSSTGIADFVKEASCGLVVKPKSAEGIAEAVGRLLGETDLWTGMSEKCVAFADGFRTPAITERLLRLYER